MAGDDRLDMNISDKDHIFIHSKVDHGVQPTQTSFLDPIFSASSPQPSYEGQLGETHTFNSQLTNQFLFAASYYRAIFTNMNGATLGKSDIPFVLIPEAYCLRRRRRLGPFGVSNPIGDLVARDYAFPQGRNVTGYQFNDDLSWTQGKHTVKVGYAFRRDDITDYTSSEHNITYGGGENIVL